MQRIARETREKTEIKFNFLASFACFAGKKLVKQFAAVNAV
jgi:hypothetical protein